MEDHALFGWSEAGALEPLMAATLLVQGMGAALGSDVEIELTFKPRDE